MSSQPPSPHEPTLIGKVFALREVRPFDRLSDGELTLLAETARPLAYAPAAQVHVGGVPLNRLLVVVGGKVRDGSGRPAGPILGVSSLLNRAPSQPLAADPSEGARLLEISGRHFFTLAKECPGFVLGLLELGECGVREGAP